MRRRFLYKKTDEEVGVEIGGLIWATRNIGMPGKFAETPEDYGMFYKVNSKTAWPSIGDISASNPASNGSTVWDESNYSNGSWQNENDPSPSGWRLPTGGIDGEIQTLWNAKFLWDSFKRGYWFANNQGDLGDPSRSIFIPAAGHRQNIHGLLGQGNEGFCWSSTTYYTVNAYRIYFIGGEVYTNAQSGGSSAASIRCVKIV